MINRNKSIYEYNILKKDGLNEFILLMKDFLYSDEEIAKVIYSGTGLLENKIYNIYVIVDYKKRKVEIVPNE